MLSINRCVLPLLFATFWSGVSGLTLTQYEQKSFYGYYTFVVILFFSLLTLVVGLASAATIRTAKFKAQEGILKEELAQMKESINELEQAVESLYEEVSVEKRRFDKLMKNVKAERELTDKTVEDKST